MRTDHDPLILVCIISLPSFLFFLILLTILTSAPLHQSNKHCNSMLSTGEQAGFEVSHIRQLMWGFTDQSQATIIRPDGTKYSMANNSFLGQRLIGPR